MSGVYWGIVAGLVALVVMLVACIDMLATGDRGDASPTVGSAGGQADASKQASVGTRLAA